MSSSLSSSKPRTSIYITDQAQISSYNRGPITSLLALPESCTNTLTYVSRLYFGHYSSVYDPACVVPGTLDNSQIAPGSAWAKYYYSPAICPQGWTVAHTFSKCFTVDPANNCLELKPETSAALCCPSGYTSLQSGHQCASTITLGQTMTFITPTQAGLVWETGSPITNIATATAQVRGDGIPIWWQSSDVAMLSAAAAGTPASRSPAETSSGGGGGLVGEPSSAVSSSSTASDTALNTATAAKESSGLSTGAKAGIGVGVALGVVGAGLLMGFLIWRRRRNRSKNAAAQPVQLGDGRPGKKADPPIVYQQRQEMEPVYPRHEMQGDMRYELPAENK